MIDEYTSKHIAKSLRAIAYAQLTHIQYLLGVTGNWKDSRRVDLIDMEFELREEEEE